MSMMNKLLAQNIQIPWMDDSSITVQGELAGSPTLGNIISNAMDLVFVLAGVGLFLMLLMGGFTFLTSGGDSKKLEQGRGTPTNALLGFVIIFGAYWLVKIFGTIFGLDSVKNTFG
jgi:hypothetical protein